jgi:hypothetical protein
LSSEKLFLFAKSTSVFARYYPTNDSGRVIQICARTKESRHGGRHRRRFTARKLIHHSGDECLVDIHVRVPIDPVMPADYRSQLSNLALDPTRLLIPSLVPKGARESFSNLSGQAAIALAQLLKHFSRKNDGCVNHRLGPRAALSLCHQQLAPCLQKRRLNATKTA